MPGNRSKQTRSSSPGSTAGAAGFLVQPPAPQAAVASRPPAAARAALTHPTIDTYINQSSSEAARGSAANIYAKTKDKSANKIINEKGLDIDFHNLILTICVRPETAFQG